MVIGFATGTSPLTTRYEPSLPSMETRPSVISVTNRLPASSNTRSSGAVIGPSMALIVLIAPLSGWIALILLPGTCAT